MQTIEKLKNYYHETWQQIKKNRHSYSTPWQVSQRITELTDDTVIKVCKMALEKSGPVDELSVLALGGYAREQMAPHSDIDILILHRGRVTHAQEEFINAFTTIMWDLGTNPGIQIKGLKDVMKAAMEDEVVRTSFIDNRFLFGSKKDYESFLKIINDKVMEKGKTEFLKMKIDGVRTRNSKFRDSIYRLEPNIKEGTGGIRDINTIYWICKILYKTSNLQETVKHGILTQDEYSALIENCGALFSVRNEVHYYHNRKYEIMSLDAQMEVAKHLGYSGTDSVHSVELFMRDYYIRAKQTAEITQKVINRTMLKLAARKLIKKTYISKLSDGYMQYANTLTVSSKDIFKDNPKKLITVFSFAANKGLKLSDSICELIRDNLYLIDSAFIKEYGTLFTKTISSYPNSFRIVSNMYKCRVLQTIIPEFEGLECRPQFDYYHHYTVDEHTILALDYIDKIAGSVPPSLNEYQKAMQDMERKDLLSLSILLHDIGKGQGKNHSIVGAKMSKKICSRLGLSMDDNDTICSMVEQHLLMSHIAQRRDLHDIDVIEHFTSFLNSVEELRILFLLTYADMNAVGGATFNEWKNNLLKELFNKSEKAINNESVQEEFDIVLKRRRKKLEERCKNMPEIFEQSKTLDDEYVYSTKAVHIIRYLQLASEVEGDNIIVELDIRDDMHTIEVIVCTKDRVGLLSRICGALTSLSYNIKWAKIFTLENDITIDNILIDNPFAGRKMPTEKQDILKQRIIDTIKDTKDIVRQINQSESILKTQSNVFAKKDKIVFDNEVSTQYTVVDIYAKDRIGLLYDILCTFSRLKLSVERAKISTDVDRVVDSFYLMDNDGNKIVCETTLDTIREELSKNIETQTV
ncbi:MAG: [protein-PII] uridylyltransferase [Denitrovibrio sp.]|nr:MAG: [protein-PII] uridylyltransferase [Denitrovibrio sp.]